MTKEEKVAHLFNGEILYDNEGSGVKIVGDSIHYLNSKRWAYIPNFFKIIDLDDWFVGLPIKVGERFKDEDNFIFEVVKIYKNKVVVIFWTDDKELLSSVINFNILQRMERVK